MQSCATCPRRIPADETTDVFQSTLGADVCFTRGIILSRPTTRSSENERIQLTIGQACDQHGQPRPVSPAPLSLLVAAGDPQAMAAVMTNPDRKQPMTCTGCVNYVPPEVVRRELGWGLGMCAAKGELIMPSEAFTKAANCGVGHELVFGVASERDTTDGIVLLPQYDPSVGAQFNVTAAGRVSAKTAESKHRIDPREYVTDRPVSAADTAQGIRAWRCIDDPEGIHDPAWLPIFNGTDLCGFDPRSTYGLHRPDLYIDHQGLLYDVAVEWFELDETPIFNGPPGTGKSEFFCWMAWLMDLPFYRISVTKGTEDWHLAGETKLISDEHGNNITQFVKGRFSRIYSTACVCVVDEPNHKHEVFEFLRPVLDNAKQLVLDADQGTVCDRHTYFFLGLAQNPAEDARNVGTEPLAAADLDRLSTFFIGLPDPAVERTIIRTHCADMGYEITELTLDHIMQVADTIRMMVKDDGLPISWGLRPQIKVARKTKYYSFDKAYRRAVCDGLEDSVSEQIMGIVRGVQA